MRVAALGLCALVGVSAPAAAENPQILYMLHCQGCHLADGTGSAGGVPSLEGVARFATLPAGRAYLVGVPGSAQSPLTDGELAAVLNWMLVRFGPPEVAAGVRRFDAEEVARNRRPLTEVEEIRAELMRRLATQQAEETQH